MSGTTTVRRAGAPRARKLSATTRRGEASSTEPRKHFSPSQEGHGYVVARVKLRKWFWDRIDEEARSCGFNRRAEFLNALVRRKAGMLRLERHESRPRATFAKRRELGHEEVYAWNVPVQVKAMLDELLEPLDLPLRAWVSLSTLEWLGLAEVPDARAKKAA